LVDLDKARQAPEYPKTPWSELRFPPWFFVAIIGAGVAGLRTAMLLQRFGIPYKIFEASQDIVSRNVLINFLEKEWKFLVRSDWASAKSYLTRGYPARSLAR